ncbi:MAG: hypothetical protein RSE41_03380 [Clostridia bacterium]
MTKNELIDYIKNDLSASYSLPFLPPDAEIERIIDFESKYLYREYRNSITNTNYIIDLHYFKTPEFRNTRTLQLPNCVEGIERFMEVNNGSRIWGFNDPDMRFDRAMASDMYLSPMSGDQIAYRTIQWSFWDLSRSFILTDIQHSFNPNTHRLVVKGRDPQRAVYISAITKIPENDLYEDPIAIRWYTAKAKLSLAKILGTFNYSLVGGVTINSSQWSDEGKSEIEELKQYFKDINQPDYFIMTN